MSELSAFNRDMKGYKRAKQVCNLPLQSAFLKLASNHIDHAPLSLQRRLVALLNSVVNKNDPHRLNAWDCSRIGMVTNG